MCKYLVIGTGPDGVEFIADDGFSDPYDAGVAARHFTKLSENGNTYRCENEDCCMSLLNNWDDIDCDEDCDNCTSLCY